MVVTSEALLKDEHIEMRKTVYTCLQGDRRGFKNLTYQENEQENDEGPVKGDSETERMNKY